MYTLYQGRRIFFDVDSPQLTWQDRQALRPAVVALAGGPGFSHLYIRPWLTGLRERYCVVYIDLGGAGYSDRQPDGSYPMAQFVGEIEAVREALGLERWSVLGHSFGASLALEYGLAHPDRTDAVIAANGVHSVDFMRRVGMKILDGLPADTAVAIRDFADRQAAAARSGSADAWRELDRDPMWNTLNSGAFVGRVPPLWQQVAPLAEVNAQCHYGAVGGAMFDGEPTSLDGWELLPRLGGLAGTPCLFITSERDSGPPAQHTYDMAAAVPGSQVVRMDHTGHFTMVEDPATFAAAVCDFLAARRTDS